MKFNSYLVKLEHTETSFTANLMHQDQLVSVNLNKVSEIEGFFIAHFKTQIELKYLDRLQF